MRLLLSLLLIPICRRLIIVDQRHSCSRSLRSRSTHNTSIDRRPHFLSHSIGQTWHLQRHVRVDRLMVCWSSLVDKLIHLSILHFVLLVHSRLLRRISPSLRHLSNIRSFLGAMITWLLKLSMAQGNTTMLLVHSICAERSVCWCGLVRLYT